MIDRPGIYFDVPFDEYRQIKALNASIAVHGLRSIQHMKGAIDGVLSVKESDAIVTGTLIHALAEGQDIDSSICVMPDYSKDEANRDNKGARSYSWSTSWAKSKKREFIATAKDRQIVKPEVYNNAKGAFEGLKRCKAAMRWIESAKKEVTVLSEINGVLCKCRCDALAKTEFADFKSCPNSSLVPFSKHATNLHYPFKMAFYDIVLSQHLPIQKCELIAIESSGVFACRVYEIFSHDLDSYKRQALSIIRDYKRAESMNQWFADQPVEAFAFQNWDMPDEDTVDFEEMQVAQ